MNLIIKAFILANDNGQMGENMKAIILKIKNMGKGILNGRMEENIQAHGSVIIFIFNFHILNIFLIILDGK